MEENRGISPFHFLRLAPYSVFKDLRENTVAVVFLVAGLVAIDWFVGLRFDDPKDVLTVSEGLHLFCYFLFAIFSFAGNLTLTLEKTLEPFKPLPIPRNQFTLLRLIESALYSLVWVLIPTITLFAIIDPNRPHVVYLISLWLSFRAVQGLYYGLESIVALFTSSLKARQRLVLLIYPLFFPVAILGPFFKSSGREWYEWGISIVGWKWILLAAAFAVIGWIVAWTMASIRPFHPGVQSQEARKRERVRSLKIEDLRRLSPQRGRWEFFFLPSLHALSLGFWTFFVFSVFSYLPDFFGWVSDYVIRLNSNWDSEILIGTAIGLPLLFSVIYMAIGVPFLWRAIQIIPRLRLWQVLPIRTGWPIVAMIVFGYTVLLGGGMVGAVTEQQPITLHGALGSLLGVFLFAPVAQVAIHVLAPVYWKKDATLASDPIGLLVIALAILATVSTLVAVDYFELPSLARIPIISLAAVFNLWATVWMYRRY
ncbi:MAG: hypothetical protein KC917_17210 [Candidatus Omnitrophica bacterium]|nr:hypothetical protein [Candidatus Omnitrophota bacterium]